MTLRHREKRCRLIQRAQASEPVACAKLVRQYTPRLRQMTGRFAANATTTHPQLLGAAVVGLLEGVRHIQLDRLLWRPNVDPVWAYVTPWVRHALCEELGRSELGLRPAACKAWSYVWETWHHLRQQLHSEPTPEEVAATSRVSKRVVEEIFRGPAQPVLDDCNDDTAEVVGGVVVQEPNDHADQVNSKVDYLKAVQQLTSVTRQRQFIVVDVCREIFDYSYSEIVECLGQPTRGEHVVFWERVRPSLQWLLGAILQDWSQVSALFATPPPTLTPAALEQWHRRARQEIRRKMLGYLLCTLGAMAPLYAG